MKEKIVFFGTGPVSLSCLEGVHDAFELEAIITKPDRISPSGKPHAHPVKEWGKAHGVPVHQVGSKAELVELFTQRSFGSSVGLVVDFGLIIPEPVISSFTHRIINSHFSLLPALRGADPITFSLLEGRAETGVSLMVIVPALDEGDLISQERFAIAPNTTTPVLTEQLSALSNRMLIRDLPAYVRGELKPQPQAAEGVSYTRKLTKSDGILDLSNSAVQLEREVRAYLGWPGSRTTLFDIDVIITSCHLATDREEGLSLTAGDGKKLIIDRLKPAGKREMSGLEFMRGYGQKTA